MATSGVYKDKERGTYFVDKTYKGTRIKRRGFNSLTEAKAFINNAMYEIDNLKTKGVAKEDATLNDLFNKWYSVKSSEIRITTAGQHKTKYTAHVKPILGDILLSKLTTDSLSAWKVELVNKGLTSARTNDIITTFRLILKYGCDADYKINKKILSVLTPVKETKSLQEREILTYDEIDQFLATFNMISPAEKMYHDYFYLLSRTGMRPNEFRGLQVKNIKNNTLVVDHDITTKIAGRGVIIQPTKNSSSVRKVLMPEDCMKLLQEITKGYKNDDFIFGKDKPISETELRRKLNVHLDAAGLRHVTIYSFRHSHATHLIRSGVPIKVVSQRLGHSSPTMTMQVYWHLFKEDEEEVLKYL